MVAHGCGFPDEACSTCEGTTQCCPGAGAMLWTRERVAAAGLKLKDAPEGWIFFLLCDHCGEPSYI